MRVVFTGGEHVAGLAAARGLQRGGHEAHAAVGTAGSYVARSRAVSSTTVVPHARDDALGFAVAVADVARRVGADVVLPGIDAAMFAIAAHRESFDGVVTGAPPLEIVQRATDKSLLEELAADAGLAVPRTTPATREELASAAERLGYPLVVKPVRSDVEVGADHRIHVAPVVVRAAIELDAVLSSTPGADWLLQPFLESTLGAVAGVAWDGAIVCAVHQKAVRIWPPECGISSYARTVPRDAELEQGVSRLVRAIGWSGIFQAQFLHTADGPLLIDFNPRFYGSLALAIGAGLNLPAIWVDLLAGRPPRVGDYRVGVRYRTEEGDVRALRHELLHGNRGSALRGLIPRPGTVHPIFELRDPGPILVSLRKLVRF